MIQTACTSPPPSHSTQPPSNKGLQLKSDPLDGHGSQWIED